MTEVDPMTDKDVRDWGSGGGDGPAGTSGGGLPRAWVILPPRFPPHAPLDPFGSTPGLGLLGAGVGVSAGGLSNLSAPFLTPVTSSQCLGVPVTSSGVVGSDPLVSVGNTRTCDLLGGDFGSIPVPPTDSTASQNLLLPDVSSSNVGA